MSASRSTETELEELEEQEKFWKRFSGSLAEQALSEISNKRDKIRDKRDKIPDERNKEEKNLEKDMGNRGDDFAKTGFFREAFNCYHKAAQWGYARAQYEVAICFKEGRGVEKNTDVAREWFVRAERQGYTGELHSALSALSEADKAVILGSSSFSSVDSESESLSAQSQASSSSSSCTAAKESKSLSAQDATEAKREASPSVDLTASAATVARSAPLAGSSAPREIKPMSMLSVDVNGEIIQITMTEGRITVKELKRRIRATITNGPRTDQHGIEIKGTLYQDQAKIELTNKAPIKLVPLNKPLLECTPQKAEQFKKSREERFKMLALLQYDANMLYELAQCYELGLGVPSSLRNALSHYHSAAMAGHREAQKRLSIVLSTGVPGIVEKNNELANYWKEKSQTENRSLRPKKILSSKQVMFWVLSENTEASFDNFVQALEMYRDARNNRCFLYGLFSALDKGVKVGAVEKVLKCLSGETVKFSELDGLALIDSDLGKIIHKFKSQVPSQLRNFLDDLQNEQAASRQAAARTWRCYGG